MPDIKRNDTPLWELRRQLTLLALPRLAEIPQHEWDEVTERSRQIHFDGAERIAIVVSVGFVSALLSFAPEQLVSLGAFTRFFIQFALAAPLLFALLAPFYLRRMRRGLDIEILHRITRPEKDANHDHRN